MPPRARIAILALCSLVGCQTNSKSGLVKQKAGTLGKAMVTRNYAVVIDMTYPKIVEMMGGRETAIDILKSVEKMGVAILGVRMGVPSDFQNGGADLYTVIPTEIEAKVPSGRMTGKFFMLGISSDQGKTWFFVEGAQLNEDNAKSIFQNFLRRSSCPQRPRPW
jgi:hypothetical protein